MEVNCLSPPPPHILATLFYLHKAFPHSSAGKESTCNVGDLGLIPGLGRSSGEGKGYPHQYSGLENSMDYSPWGRKQSDNWVTFTFIFTYTELLIQTLFGILTKFKTSFLLSCIFCISHVLLIHGLFCWSAVLCVVHSLQLCLTLCNPIDCSWEGLSLSRLIRRPESLRRRNGQTSFSTLLCLSHKRCFFLNSELLWHSLFHLRLTFFKPRANDYTINNSSCTRVCFSLSSILMII